MRTITHVIAYMVNLKRPIELLDPAGKGRRGHGGSVGKICGESEKST